MVTDPQVLAPFFQIRTNQVTVGTSPTLVCVKDNRRVALIVTALNSANEMMILPDPAVSTSFGIQIVGTGTSGSPSYYQWTFKDVGGLVQQAWYALTSAVSGNLTVIETLWQPPYEGQPE